MVKLPNITGKELSLALQKIGFDVKRIKGSHHFLKHNDGRITVIPIHSGENIGPGLLSKILKDCDLTKEQLKELL